MSERKSTGYHTVYEALGHSYRTLLEKNALPGPGENCIKFNLSRRRGIIHLYPELAGPSRVFWRCDLRSPEQLQQQLLLPLKSTGFSWFGGGLENGVDRQSIIGLSKTIAGALFFPAYPDKGQEKVYLYAVELTGGYCDLDRMQRQVHRLINPDDSAVIDSYYPYDPRGKGEHGWCSPRHLYGDVATDKLPWHDVVACWQIERKPLLTREINIRAGVRVTNRQAAGEQVLIYRSNQAKEGFELWFKQQRENHYYSAAGIIKLKGKAPKNAREAESYYYQRQLSTHSANYSLKKQDGNSPVKRRAGAGNRGWINQQGSLSFVSRKHYIDGFEY
ncbi:hypothetical protein [Thalassomonas haliotis]|uniref:Uncharacterized protein n=1 Tax=Thalassomonas haliotis TaxID=485448 RepID=A0ABY7VD51_9GAMM|nr:hypothetical protein [Thalassomonas haliotis]WDE10838.1 hypothetical protein H3N35_21715 [Thalassomonas haliotis]